MSNETEIAYSTTESFLVRMERISFLVGAIEVLGNAVHNREILLDMPLPQQRRPCKTKWPQL